jgi:hypothetical protein
MTPFFTCPVCRRTSYHPADIQNRYCGACSQFYPPEMGRELKWSELEAKTVVILRREGSVNAMTAWIKDVGRCGISFLAGELRMYLVCARIGEEVHDDTAQLHVHQYLGGPEPTSGSLET